MKSQEDVLILQNTKVRANERMQLRGQSGVYCPTAVNTDENRTIRKSGNAVTGKSRTEEHHYKATHQITSLEAGKEIEIDGGEEKISFSATEVKVPKKVLKAPQGSVELKAVKNQEFYSLNKSSSSAVHNKSSQLGFKKIPVREFTTDAGEFTFDTPHITAALRIKTVSQDTSFIRALRAAGADLTFLDDTLCESWHEVQQSAGPLVHIGIAIAFL